MSRATLALIGDVGDVESRCQSLLGLPGRLAHLADGTEELTPEQERVVEDANWRWAGSSKDYVDRAFDAVHEWLKQVTETLEHPYPTNGR